MKILFRKINPSSDFIFFARVRRESTFYLDDATNFDDLEVKAFLEKYKINYKIVSFFGVPVGYVRLSIVEYEGRRLQSVGLDLAPEFRGKKLSVPIYQKLIKEQRKIDLPIILWVLDFNFRAIHIYEKVGFKFVKSRPFIQNGSERECNKILMEYNL